MNEQDKKTRQERQNTRLTLVQGILREAMTRANSLGKIMVDPIDVLTFLTHDPKVVQELVGAGINLEKLGGEIKKVDEKTPQGEAAAAFMEAFGIRPGNYRSFVLDQSIAEATRIADSEGCFDVTSLHLLAGMLRHGGNTAAIVFRKVGITEDQLAILSRTEKDK